MIFAYRPEDFKKLVPRNQDKWLFERYDMESSINRTAQNGFTWTIAYHDAMAIVGVIPLYDRNGVGETFILPDESMLKHHKKAFIRELKNLIEYCLSSNFWRLQTIGPVTDLQKRWMEFLGYQQEGIMRAYLETKEDMAIYARVKL